MGPEVGTGWEVDEGRKVRRQDASRKGVDGDDRDGWPKINRQVAEKGWPLEEKNRDRQPNNPNGTEAPRVARGQVRRHTCRDGGRRPLRARHASAK